MRKYYEEHKESFKHEAGIKLGDIGVSRQRPPEEQRKRIDEAYAALKAGADWAETAQKYSDTPSSEREGVVGFIEEVDYPNLIGAIGETLPKLEKGQLSEILDTPEGFLILKALDKHTGGILSFDLAQNEIYGALIQIRLQPKVREYLDSLREEGFVEVHQGYVDTGAVKKREAAAGKTAQKENKN
jgi:parvulin-like peptidyl-prolyl isomerase